MGPALHLISSIATATNFRLLIDSRDTFHLDACAKRESVRAKRATDRIVAREESLVYLIKRRPLGHVLEHDGPLNQVGHGLAVRLQRGLNVFHRLSSFFLDAT